MANTYDIGDVVRIYGAFSQASIPIDPSTVTLQVAAPDATSVTYTYAGATIVKDSVGNYHVDIDILQRGTYRYRWSSTGTGKAAEENWFQVRTQRVT